MQTTVYRYVKLDSLQRIRTEGLMPTEHNMKILNGALNSQPAVYALTAPQPPEWTHNHQFPNIWQRLKTLLTPAVNPMEQRGGNLLLAVEVDTAKDNVYVADWAPMEALEQEYPKLLAKRSHAEAFGTPRDEMDSLLQLNERREVAHRQRLESMVPLERYIADPSVRENISLPEVIILSPIPPDRIRIADEQPLLIEQLEGTRRSRLATTRAVIASRMQEDEELACSTELARWFAAEEEQAYAPNGTERSW